MRTEEYIRQQAKRKNWKKYYSTMRPVGIGTCPTKGMIDYINYDCRIVTEKGRAWAELYYDRDLTAEELSEYELVRA